MFSDPIIQRGFGRYSSASTSVFALAIQVVSSAEASPCFNFLRHGGCDSIELNHQNLSSQNLMKLDFASCGYVGMSRRIERITAGSVPWTGCSNVFKFNLTMTHASAKRQRNFDDFSIFGWDGLSPCRWQSLDRRGLIFLLCLIFAAALAALVPDPVLGFWIFVSSQKVCFWRWHWCVDSCDADTALPLH